MIEEHPKPPQPGLSWPHRSSEVPCFELTKNQSCQLFRLIKLRHNLKKGEAIRMVKGIPTVIKVAGTATRAVNRVVKVILGVMP